MHQKIGNLVIAEDGTVITPSLHDALLTKIIKENSTLKLEFRPEQEGKNIVLKFENIGDLNICYPESFLVFRLSSFDIFNVTEEHFYFKHAVDSIHSKDGAGHLRKQYTQDFQLFYFEGGVGGTISLMSKCCTYYWA